MKEESEKAGLKLNIQKTKITASNPKLREEKWKHYQICFSWDTKPLLMLAAAMKLKTKQNKTLAPWKESYDKHRQHIKSKVITFLTKLRIIKAMAFPVTTQGCKSWAIKKAEH